MFSIHPVFFLNKFCKGVVCLLCFSLSLITCILFIRSSSTCVFFVYVIVCISMCLRNCDSIGMYIGYLFRLCWMSFYTNLLHIHVFMYFTLLKPAHQYPSIHTHAFHPFQCMHTHLPDSEEVLSDFYVLLFSQSLLSSFPRMLSLAKLKCSSKTFQSRHVRLLIL